VESTFETSTISGEFFAAIGRRIDKPCLPHVQSMQDDDTAGGACSLGMKLKLSQHHLRESCKTTPEATYSRLT